MSVFSRAARIPHGASHISSEFFLSKYSMIIERDLLQLQEQRSNRRRTRFKRFRIQRNNCHHNFGSSRRWKVSTSQDLSQPVRNSCLIPSVLCTNRARAEASRPSHPTSPQMRKYKSLYSQRTSSILDISVTPQVRSAVERAAVGSHPTPGWGALLVEYLLASLLIQYLWDLLGQTMCAKSVAFGVLSCS